MSIKRGLKYKKGIVVATIISIALLIIGFKIIHTSVVQYIHLQAEEKMMKVSEILVNQINGDNHKQFVGDDNIEGVLDEETSRLLLKAKEEFSEITNVYIMIRTEEPDIWKVVLTTDIDIQNKMLQEENQDLVMSEMYLGSITDETFVYKEENNFVSIYRPIYNSNREQVAILGMDVKESMALKWAEKLLNKVWFFLVIIILILSFFCLRAVDKISKPIELLVEQSEEVKQRKKLYFLENIDGELGLLVKKFNKILQKNQYEKEEQQKLINKITEEKENIFEVYKDVIEAVTQSKILLLSRESFIEKLSNDFPLYSTKLTKIQDITRCRREIDDTLTIKKFPWWNGKNRRNILLCLSEAITNVIKHAGSGEVLLSAKNYKLTIYILDNGKGIDLKKLPYIIFVKGFSTKQTSLGTGFLLMGKYMDKIILSTSKEGTFLALQKQIYEEEQI